MSTNSNLKHIAINFCVDGHQHGLHMWHDVTPSNVAERYRHYLRQVRKHHSVGAAQARHIIMQDGIAHAINHIDNEFVCAAFLNLMLHDHPPLCDAPTVYVFVEGDSRAFKLTFVGTSETTTLPLAA